jgi:hypothetical protein
VPTPRRATSRSSLARSPGYLLSLSAMRSSFHVSSWRFWLLLVLSSLPAHGQQVSAWDWWHDLAVENLAGETIRPSGDWLVLIFISEECPVANASIPILNQLQADFGQQGFLLVGVYCDPTLEKEQMAQHHKAFALSFETADDREQALVRWTRASYTPEALVYNAKGQLLYRGRIDNRVEDFGIKRPKATRRELREAMERLLAGEKGPFEFVPGFGCSILQKVP